MLAPVRTIAPADLPVSIDESKAQLRVDHADDDILITGLIAAATEHVEVGSLGRALVTQTWRGDFSMFPECDELRLPLAPVQSITSVAYSDDNNANQVFSSASYSLFNEAVAPMVVLGKDQSWPSTYWRRDAVRVTFVAGYGAPAAVPEPIRQAILMLVGHWYENRESVVVGNLSAVELPLGVRSLLAPYRRFGM